MSYTKCNFIHPKFVFLAEVAHNV